MTEKIVIAINLVWLYLCLAPTLIIVAFLLIGKGLARTKNARNEPRVHKHNWRRDIHGSWMDIPKVQPK